MPLGRGRFLALGEKPIESDPRVVAVSGFNRPVTRPYACIPIDFRGDGWRRPRTAGRRSRFPSSAMEDRWFA